MPSNYAEHELLQRAQRGDEEAFARLYEAHRGKIFSICLRITQEAAEAEDCMQEAFLQFFRRISTFRGESALSTWLYRLTMNVVLMRLRKKRLNEFSMFQSHESEEGSDKTVAGTFPVPDITLKGAVDRITLNRAIGELPFGCRTVFVMHDVQGMAHSEIARVLGCSVGNSKSQLHQARLRLRKILRRNTKPRHLSPARLQAAHTAQVAYV
ncbi:MAG: RNA polymerase sigma factor [Acidobacteria bacterium]|jgi:RNA polymerase sigma-70 factor (ECF subfamily)|nr:RNA polymerase sigma factor [Acidobacteriota bacterium]